MGEDISPEAGDVAAMSEDISPEAGDVAAMSEDVSPEAGDLAAMGNFHGRLPLADAAPHRKLSS